MRKTVVFDFDGVIHKYSKGWQDGSIYDIPNDGIIDLINELRVKLGYTVIIVSTRCATEEGLKSVKDWCILNGIIVDDICKEKPPALVYIDDRAIKYDPKDNNLLNEIMAFQPEAKKTEAYEKLNELELLGLLKIRNNEFRVANNELDKLQNNSSNIKNDMITSLKIMDEWIAAVKKYVK